MPYQIHECTTSEALYDADTTPTHRLVYWPDKGRWTHHWVNIDDTVKILVSERRRLITWVDPSAAIRALNDLHHKPDWQHLMTLSRALPEEIHEAYMYLWTRSRQVRRLPGDSTLSPP